MNINDLLFYQGRMKPQFPGGDATLGSTGRFVPRGPMSGAMPQFADPRVQAMLPPVPGPARNVGPVPGASAGRASLPMQGPPMPAEFNVQGYSKGLANAGPGAQAYADQFAGGDLSKVRSRLMNVDGQMVNDFYTRGLLDGPMTQPAPEAAMPAAGQDPNLLMRIFGGLFGGGQ